MNDTAPLLGQPGWRRLLNAARRSLERTGGRLDASISLSTPDDAERLVIIGITGVYRPTTAGRLTVRLADLDAHLQAVSGVGLVAALSAAEPVRDRPGERKREALERDALLSFATESRHGRAGWYEEWLDGMRRDGTLTRVIRGRLPFDDVIAVLDALPANDEPMPVFAERVLGDTKALSDGPVRALVLRALATWRELPPPTGAEQERALWELLGVVPDDLASQVVVLNVPATGGLIGSWLTSAAAAHVPIRTTLHQLRLASLVVDVDEIYVCENPAVLRAAAGAATRPLICVEGTPSVAAHALLRSLRPGAVIHWRNDFDWAGVRLTASALARYPAAVPWRMGSTDYRAAAPLSGPGLIGKPIPTPWEPTLAEAMATVNIPVMEERLLDVLLTDVRR